MVFPSEHTVPPWYVPFVQAHTGQVVPVGTHERPSDEQFAVVIVVPSEQTWYSEVPGVHMGVGDAALAVDRATAPATAARPTPNPR